MTEEQKALARRAVACKGWRGMPGMRAVGRYPDYPVRVHAFGENVRDTDDMQQPEPWGWQQPTPYGDSIFPGPYLPDLTDPATLGCLLSLVREAWRCPTVYVRQSTTRRVSDGALAWEVCDLWLDAEACRALGVDRQGSVGSWGHASEAEALVAALESAP